MLHWLWVLIALQAGVLLGMFLAALIHMASHHPWEEDPGPEHNTSQESS